MLYCGSYLERTPVTVSRRLLPVSVLALVAGIGVTCVPSADAASAPDGGAIARYAEGLADSPQNLGPAVTPDLPTPFRPGAYQVFSVGSVYWSAGTGAWDVRGAIRDDWAHLGYENSALGFPTSREGNIANTGSTVLQVFQGGLVYYDPAVGAHEVRGAILQEYAALGYERSRIGLPVTDELAAPDRVGRFEVFQRGSIYWSPLTGAHEIEGDIRTKWGSIGYEQSLLGYPTTDEVDVPGGRQSGFLLGSITWKPSTGALVTGFFAPVSSVDRRRSVFTVQLLQQSFPYDSNDTFLRLPLASGSTGQLPEPIPLTKAQFTDALGVDTFVIAQGWSPDPKAHATFEILDIASVPKTPQARAALVQALRTR